MTVELTDEEAAQLTAQLEASQGQGSVAQLGNFPEPPSKDTLLLFMRDVVKEDDPKKLSKTANFREEEVGRPKTPSLTYMQTAHYADAEGYEMVGDYLRGKVGNIALLSLGRKAKLLETLFTVRRETRNLGTPKVTREKKFFGGEKVTHEGMDT